MKRRPPSPARRAEVGSAWALIAAGVFYFAWPWVHAYVEPGVHDPIAIRFAVVALAGALLALSYHRRGIRFAAVLGYSACWTIGLHVLYLSRMNGGDAGAIVPGSLALTWVFSVLSYRQASWKRAAEAEAARARGFLRQILDAISDPIFVYDAQHHVSLANEAYCAELGRAPAALVGACASDLLPVDVAARFTADLDDVLATGVAKEGEASSTSAVGKVRFVSRKLEMLRDIDGRRFVVGIDRDLSERQAAKVALQQSVTRCHEMFDQAAVGMLQVSLRGLILEANLAFCRMLGYARTELLGRHMAEITHADDRGKVMVAFEAGAEAALGGGVSRERRFLCKDGSTLWTSLTPAQVHVAKDVSEYFIVVVEDIGARKQADAELRSRKAFVEALVLSSSDGIIVVDAKGTKVLQNTRTNELWKMPKAVAEDPQDAPQLQFVMDQTVDPKAFVDKVVYLYAHPDETSRDEVVLKDGTILDRYSAPVPDGQGHYYGRIWSFRDVTALKAIERALHESEAKYREIVDVARVGIVAVDTVGCVTLANPSLERMFGWAPGEMLGHSLFEFIVPADLEASRERFATEREESAREDRRFLRKDGSELWCLLDVVRTTDATGVDTGLRATLIDITERKTAEQALVAARQAAEAAARAKSDFLARMSHEIRTPMNGIMGMTQLALSTKLDAEQREYLETVTDSAAALLAIINDILDFSKIEVGKLELELVAFSLRDTFGAALRVVAAHAQAKGLEITLDVAAEVPDHLIGDPGRLRQVLVNLLGNAVKFTERGEIVLTVRVVERKDDDVLLDVSVRDTGIGVPQDKQAGIFEAFTQADGSVTRRFGGTGLGLTISAQLVTMMGGHLAVESEPGRGSTFGFTVQLPLATDDAAEAGAESARLQLQGLHQRRLEEVATTTVAKATRPLRVLVAEDNLINQRVTCAFLQKMGHTFVSVENGRLALEALSREPFDLVLMDAQMPEMDGFEATRAIRAGEVAGGPRLPVISLTAQAMVGDRERCLAAGADDYVSKPIRADLLYQAIEQATERQAPTPTHDLPAVVPTPPLAPAPASAVDFVAMLDYLGGDLPLQNEIGRMLLEDLPALVHAVHEQVTLGTAVGLEHAAHKLKGSLASLKADAAADAAATIETMGRARNLTEVEQALSRLDGEVGRVEAELTAWVAAGSAQDTQLAEA